MMKSLTISRAPVARAALAPRSRGRLVVRANTLWSLAPRDDAKDRFKTTEHCIDLTNAIGQRRVCSIAAKDYAATESIDYTVVDHGGVHILFEAEGASNPLDSPSILYVTDVDSACEVRVEGKPLPKKERTRVRPGAKIHLGENAEYTVLRNVFAHA